MTATESDLGEAPAGSLEAAPESGECRHHVVVADHRSLVREGLAALVEREHDMCVVREVGSLQELTKAVGEYDARVAVIGHRPPHLDGVRAAERLRGQAIVVLLVDDSDSSESCLRAIESEVRGLLHVEEAREQLAAAIRSVHSGASVVGSSLLRRVTALVALPDERLREQILSTLSARELQVFKLVGSGMSNGEVAQALSISAVTVKSHMNRVSRKLAVRDRAQAIVLAHRSGTVAF